MTTTHTHQSNGETITVEAAEKRFSIAGHNLRRWVREKKVEGRKEARKFFIDVKSLERFLADHGKQRQSPEPAVANGQVDAAPTSDPEVHREPETVDLHGPATSGPGEHAAKATRKETSGRKARTGRKPSATPTKPPRFKNMNRRLLRRAKDGMRKFNVAELRVMREWILQRLDHRAKLA